MEEQKLINIFESIVENINSVIESQEKMAHLLEEMENEDEELRKQQWMIIQILKKTQQEINELKWKRGI